MAKVVVKKYEFTPRKTLKIKMLQLHRYEERGDGPAQAILQSNSQARAIRKAVETREELDRIKERVTQVSFYILSSLCFPIVSQLYLCILPTLILLFRLWIRTI